MKTLNEVKKKKKAIFAFGRMNPPTLGHEKLILKVLDLARRDDATPYIFLSHTQDSKKNPLTSSQKLKYLRLGVPKAERNIVASDNIKTPFDALGHLVDLGYTDVVMVAGQDRVPDFNKTIGSYVNHPDPEKSFELDSFRVVSAGERDPDSDGAVGMSGTKMRQFAVANNFTQFKRGVPSHLSDRYAKEMFDAIRKAMKIEEMVEEIQRLKNTLNIPRNKMPQIKREYINDFIKSLTKSGISVTKRELDVAQLKPTQSEINMNKVREKYEKFVNGVKVPKPFIVSYDNYILDGHHQLFALQTLDSHIKVLCYHVGLKMKDLISFAGEFPKTTYKEIDD
jgi:hypothetical protein